MSANTLTFADMIPGLHQEREYTISKAVHQAFLEVSQDRSPIHVDKVAAMERGFAGRVMHGAILNAFLSHFIGMVFPGRNALLLSVELRYANPSYLDDTLLLSARVMHRSDSHSVVELKIIFENRTRGVRAASGKALVKVVA
ncbi:MAG: hypothetical protein HQL77_09980 [Magnetococcales bacterium]|nr:hypothetical protein [Magnetococcales bacterium]